MHLPGAPPMWGLECLSCQPMLVFCYQVFITANKTREGESMVPPWNSILL